MSIGDVKDLISGIGFPIVVSLYLLWVMNRTLQGVTTALERLSDAIDVLCGQRKS